MPSLRIDVADLLAHPGSRRSVVCDAEVEALGTSVAAVSGPVRLDLSLERVSDGIVVRGTVHCTWTGPCGTCLRKLVRGISIPVDELFELAPLEGETYPIDGHVIEVEQMMRDSVLLELPLAPRCDPPCQPLELHDPEEDGPADDAAAVDPRWAALSGLDL
jgi:uncharacterized protein